jgi:carbonic anhydrase/acetyltransferase-like protein (isoleucine patch superfamily)
MDPHVIAVGDRVPDIAPSAWVASTATVVGEVTVGPSTGVFYSAVLRADLESVVVGRAATSRTQRSCTPNRGRPARIGTGVGVRHGAVLHGCTVEDGCLVGMNATVRGGAIIGEGSLVAAGALVLEDTVVPPRSLVAGVPAKIRRELTAAEVEHCRANATTYEELTRQHAQASTAARSALTR